MCSLGCLPSQLSLGLLSHGLLRGSHRTVPGTGCSHTGRPLGRSCPAALPIKTNSKSRVLDPLLKATGLQESLCFITKAPYLNSDVSLNGSPFRVQCVTPAPSSDSLPSKNWNAVFTSQVVVCHSLELPLKGMSPVSGAVSLAQLCAPLSLCWILIVWIHLFCTLYFRGNRMICCS